MMCPQMKRPLLLMAVGLLMTAATAARTESFDSRSGLGTERSRSTETTNDDLSFLVTPQTPDVDITSFAGRAQRCFEEADICILALTGHPGHPDDAIASLLQQYRRQLLRGRMELARARAVRQPVQPAVTLLERFTAEHLLTLRHLLPHLSPVSQTAVRHTLRFVAQCHQSAQASLTQQAAPPPAGSTRNWRPFDSAQGAIPSAVEGRRWR